MDWMMTSNLVEEYLANYRMMKEAVCDGRQQEADRLKHLLRVTRHLMTEEERDEMIDTLAGIRSKA
jgi:hypothetical protein